MCYNSIVSTHQPYKLQCASIVYMVIYVTMLQVYKTTRYLLVKRCLCIVQVGRFFVTVRKKIRTLLVSHDDKKAAHLHYTQASFNQQISCSFIDL